MAIKRISADELEIGMYVSRLDRPWRETPFLFQGFHVVEQSEIDEIKDQTRHVYILVPDEEIEVSTPRPGRSGPGPDQYNEAHARRANTEFERELPAARKSHAEIAGLVEEIEDTLDSNEELDVPRIKQTIGYMVRSIERNPDYGIVRGQRTALAGGR